MLTWIIGFGLIGWGTYIIVDDIRGGKKSK